MAIIDPKNGKYIFSSKEEFDAEYGKKHFETIKLYAEHILNSGIKSAHDLRIKIVGLYHAKLREHEAEVVKDPRKSIAYLLSCLEVYHICLQHIFETFKAQEEVNKLESLDNTESEKVPYDPFKNKM